MKFKIFTAAIILSLSSPFAFAYKPNKNQQTPVIEDSITVTRGSAQCADKYPLGQPKTTADIEKIERRSFYICASGYALQLDPEKKTPLWVSESLNKARLQSPTRPDRTNDFRPNQKIPYSAQATLNDYRNSGFDRGHLAPAADMTGYGDTAMSESFYLTNMVPQVGQNHNRGIWADLESKTRQWAISNGDVQVITGPVFQPGFLRLGRSGVAVPTHMYKIIIKPSTGESVSFLIPNQQIRTNQTRNFTEGKSQFPQTTAANAIECIGQANNSCLIGNFVTTINNIESLTNLNLAPNLSASAKNTKDFNPRTFPLN